MDFTRIERLKGTTRKNMHETYMNYCDWIVSTQHSNLRDYHQKRMVREYYPYIFDFVKWYDENNDISWRGYDQNEKRNPGRIYSISITDIPYSNERYHRIFIEWFKNLHRNNKLNRLISKIENHTK